MPLGFRWWYYLAVLPPSTIKFCPLIQREAGRIQSWMFLLQPAVLVSHRVWWPSMSVVRRMPAMQEWHWSWRQLERLVRIWLRCEVHATVTVHHSCFIYKSTAKNQKKGFLLFSFLRRSFAKLAYRVILWSFFLIVRLKSNKWLTWVGRLFDYSRTVVWL